ncbi:MAG: hypothetical protein ACKVJE_17480 [Pseudomonadales bacterium]
MKKQYVLYDVATMNCIGSTECEELGVLPVIEASMGQPAITLGAIESAADWETSYVNSAMEVVPQGDYTLEALPLPCTATIEGVEYLLTQQESFTFTPLDVEMAYVITIDAGVEYLKKEFTVNVDPA